MSTKERYAARTDVPESRTRGDLERLVKSHGAQRFMAGTEPGRAVVMFEMNLRRVRIDIPLREGKALRETEQLTRSAWRALLLVIKAKLEAVAAGITIFEDEFMANIVMPSGQTVGQWARPQIDRMYDKNEMPPMLPGGS